MNSRLYKCLFLFLGIVSLVLAYIGVLLPGVPAIPFILLAGYCFLQGSPKLYQWLSDRKYIGAILKKYSSGNASKGAIWFVISQLWISLIVAQVIIKPHFSIIILINVGGIISSVIIWNFYKK
ncbi:YbaN family protein [Xanthocytophaga agilis]|uniref:YbaN family protein n=1 Tax=Xanthocytophaga agilis TaxID=3048010 RepID=UPI003B00744B